jgi:hypothetical protein
MATKRKLLDENRQYNEIWENDYFHIMVNNKLTCLICKNSSKVIKGFNVKRHYSEQHSEYDNFTGELRKPKILALKKDLSAQQHFFKSSMEQAPNIVKASFLVSNLIAKKLKPYSDGEFVKECMISVINAICPEKGKLIGNVSLSRQTITRRISDIASRNVEILRQKIKQFEFFSLCLDESTDICDSAQLAIFIRGIDSNFCILEELLDLKTLKDTTTGNDIFNAFWESFTENNLLPAALSGIATDGAPSMTGKNKGFLALLKDKMSDFQINSAQFYIFHCVIHQGSLCSQTLQMNEVMDVVVKTVNVIRSRGLFHRQFQQYLEELNSHYGDVVYFSNVRWLSRGNCLKRFLDLKKEIQNFMELQNKAVAQLSDENWLLDLCFLVDITTHLNQLNLKLQGENKLITESCSEIKSFTLKLHLWENQLRNGDATHFAELINTKCSVQKDFSKYADCLNKLKEAFDSRFQEIAMYDKHFELFRSPFNVDPSTAPSSLQLELIDLQCNPELKTIFLESDNKVQFYAKFIEQTKYPNLRKFAAKIISAFGSTVLCESFFSKMTFCKNKHRASMSDKNMQDQLRIATSHIEIDMNDLSKCVEKQISH